MSDLYDELVEGAFRGGNLVAVTGNEEFAKELAGCLYDRACYFAADMSADYQTEAHRLRKVTKAARGAPTDYKRPAAIVDISTKGDLWDWFTGAADAVFDATSPTLAKVEKLRAFPHQKWLHLNPRVGSAWLEGDR